MCFDLPDGIFSGLDSCLMVRTILEINDRSCNDGAHQKIHLNPSIERNYRILFSTLNSRPFLRSLFSFDYSTKLNQQHGCREISISWRKIQGVEGNGRISSSVFVSTNDKLKDKTLIFVGCKGFRKVVSSSWFRGPNVFFFLFFNFFFSLFSPPTIYNSAISYRQFFFFFLSFLVRSL